MTSLLKKRLEDKKSTGPVVPNYTLNMPPITIQQPAIAAPLPATLQPAGNCELLIPQTSAPGPKLSIAEFCEQYDIDNKVRDRLIDEGYRSSASFAYTKIIDLSDAGFKRGEISELKVAISQWSVPNPL